MKHQFFLFVLLYSCFLRSFYGSPSRISLSDIHSDNVNLRDTKITTFGLNLDISEQIIPEYDEVFVKIPLGVESIILDFLDIKDLYAFYISSRKCAKAVIQFSFFSFSKNEHFKLKVPRHLAFPTYAAFFRGPRDLSRFSGLKGCVIDVSEFIGLNFISSFHTSQREISYSNFVPESDRSNSKDLELFFQLHVDSDWFGNHLRHNAFLFLQRMVFYREIPMGRNAFVEIGLFHTEYFLPYTYQAALRASISEDSFYSILIKFVDALIIQINTISPNFLGQMLECIPEKYKSLFIHLILNKCITLNIPIETFDAILQTFLSSISVYDYDVNCEYAHVSVFLFGISINFEYPSNIYVDFVYDGFFKILTLLVRIPRYWIKYFFFELLKIDLFIELEALRYLLVNDVSEGLDLVHFMQEYGTPECISYCFIYFLLQRTDRILDLLIVFLNAVLKHFDLSAPRTDKLAIFTKFYCFRTNFGSSDLENLVRVLRNSKQPITFVRRMLVNGLTIFDFPRNESLMNFVTSHFDLLFLDSETEIMYEILNETNVNSTHICKLLYFDRSVFVKTKVHLTEDQVNFGSILNPQIGHQLDALYLQESEWTYLQLALALGKFKLAEAILNHPAFDIHSLSHKIHGEIDTARLLTIISWKYKGSLASLIELMKIRYKIN